MINLFQRLINCFRRVLSIDTCGPTASILPPKVRIVVSTLCSPKMPPKAAAVGGGDVSGGDGGDAAAAAAVVAAAAAAAAAVAAAATAPAAGLALATAAAAAEAAGGRVPSETFPPRHRMPFNSTNEGHKHG